MALAESVKNLALAAAGDLLVEWWVTVARSQSSATRASEPSVQMLRLVEHLAASPLALQLFPRRSLRALELSPHATYEERTVNRSVAVDWVSGAFEIAYRDERGTSVRREVCVEVSGFDWKRPMDWLSTPEAKASDSVGSAG